MPSRSPKSVKTSGVRGQAPGVPCPSRNEGKSGELLYERLILVDRFRAGAGIAVSPRTTPATPATALPYSKTAPILPDGRRAPQPHRATRAPPGPRYLTRSLRRVEADARDLDRRVVELAHEHAVV
jgi:hypothetical protein